MPLATNKLATNGSVQLLLEHPVTHPWGSLNIVASNVSGLGGAPGPIKFKLYITDAANPTDVDLVDPGAIIPVDGRYELSCRLIRQGEKVFVEAPAGLSVRAELNLAIED